MHWTLAAGLRAPCLSFVLPPPTYHPPNANAPQSLDAAHYDSLRERVASLRSASRSSAAALRARREAESAELLEAEVAWEHERSALQTEKKQLELALQESVDARQVQRLALEKAARHAEERARRHREARHAAEARAAEQLAAAGHQLAHELTQADERHAADIAAVREAAAGELRTAREAADDWREKCEALAATHEAELLRVKEGSVGHLREVISSEEEWRVRAEEVSTLVDTLQEEVSASRAHAKRLEDDLVIERHGAAEAAKAHTAAVQDNRARVEKLLAQMQEEVTTREGEVARVRQDSADALAAARAQHEAEMAAVRARVEALVKRKNGTRRSARPREAQGTHGVRPFSDTRAACRSVARHVLQTPSASSRRSSRRMSTLLPAPRRSLSRLRRTLAGRRGPLIRCIRV